MGFLVWLPHLQETMQVVGENNLTSHLEVPNTQQQGCSSFRLSNLSLPLSGLFTCMVATFTQEAVASRRLTVVRKPSNFLLEVEETSGGLVLLSAGPREASLLQGWTLLPVVDP